MKDDGLHSLISLSKFKFVQAGTSDLTCHAVLTGHFAISISKNPSIHFWSQIRIVIDKVHRHVGRHSTYSDMRTLLQRKHLWCGHAQHYSSDLIRRCASCISSSHPPSTRKVALGLLNLHRTTWSWLTIFIWMISVSSTAWNPTTAPRLHKWYLMPLFSPSQWNLNHPELLSFCWPWLFKEIRLSKTNNLANTWSHMVLSFAKYQDGSIRRTPRNPKTGWSDRSSYVWYTNLPLPNKYLLAHRAVSNSNDLYGFENMLSFEISKGYTKPLLDFVAPESVPQELVESRDLLIAKRKINLVMRSKGTSNPTIEPGNLVQLFIKHCHKNRGNWSSPGVVSAVYQSFGSINVPGYNGKQTIAYIEDTRVAVIENNFYGGARWKLVNSFWTIFSWRWMVSGHLNRTATVVL